MKPAKSPSAITPLVPATARPNESGKKPATPRSSEALPMPHERDQGTDMTTNDKDPGMEQAGKDVKRGVKDTSKGPEMDTAYKRLKR